MKLVSITVSLLALAVTARGDTVMLDPHEVEALTPIDRLPNQQHLTTVFGPTVATELAAIAKSYPDLGVQLRAIRSLAGFCPGSPTPCGVGTITHDTLRDLLQAYLDLEDDVDMNPATKPGPKDVLRLRAVIEALGVSAGSAALDADVDELAKFLDHTSRDIRAATAKALGALCNTRAIPPLRTQLQNETTGVTGKAQVRLAISAALRDLQSGQCTPP